MQLPRPVDEYTGQKDSHTGVSSAYGIPYTFEKIESPPESDAVVYRITCVSKYSDEPMYKNVYFVPSDRLDFFFDGWGQSGERLIDIRPVSWDEAEAEMATYRDE